MATGLSHIHGILPSVCRVHRFRR